MERSRRDLPIPLGPLCHIVLSQISSSSMNFDGESRLLSQKGAGVSRNISCAPPGPHLYPSTFHRWNEDVPT